MHDEDCARQHHHVTIILLSFPAWWTEVFIQRLYATTDVYACSWRCWVYSHLTIKTIITMSFAPTCSLFISFWVCLDIHATKPSLNKIVVFASTPWLSHNLIPRCCFRCSMTVWEWCWNCLYDDKTGLQVRPPKTLNAKQRREKITGLSIKSNFSVRDWRIDHSATWVHQLQVISHSQIINDTDWLTDWHCNPRSTTILVPIARAKENDCQAAIFSSFQWSDLASHLISTSSRIVANWLIMIQTTELHPQLPKLPGHSASEYHPSVHVSSSHFLT